MQFNDLEALFAKAKDKTTGKPVKLNTRIVQVGPDYAIRFYETDIVTFKPDGSIVLNSGGYRTATTKQRINEFAPMLTITQKNGLWYVQAQDQTVLFTDNMVIPPHGFIGNDEDAHKALVAKKTVDKMVSRYIRGFVNDMIANGISEPSDGDCWCCNMRNVDNPNIEPMGYDHYVSHFKENYYVPTIFYKALQERKYGNLGLVLNMMKTDADFLKREGTIVLQRFFRTRKLEIAKALGEST